MSVSVNQTLVYVQNMRGNPLMPTVPRKARKLLKQNKAKVVKRMPFTIQLQYATGETKQDIRLGIDSGYSMIGISAITKNQEVINGELELRKNVSEKLTERRMYRMNRRNRLLYRKPRFNNRISSKKKGWLAPSIQHKLDSHIRLVEKIKQILPINEIILEVASFDTQKMQKPEISGIEYQQGELHGYEIREYLLEKWKRKCVYCNRTDIPLEIEHIVPKSRGGSNKVSNLTISCKKCNVKKGNKTAKEFGFPDIQKQANQSLKATPFMNVVRTYLANQLQCQITFGYITKHDRIKLGLEKSHSNDAFVIATGSNQKRCKPFKIKQMRRNNRCLQLNRKGFKPSIRRKRYKFQPNDLVKVDNKEYLVKGTFNYGTWVKLKSANGKKGIINKIFLKLLKKELKSKS